MGLINLEGNLVAAMVAKKVVSFRMPGLKPKMIAELSRKLSVSAVLKQPKSGLHPFHLQILAAKFRSSRLCTEVHPGAKSVQPEAQIKLTDFDHCTLMVL